jgi:hypothetical protein
MALCLTVAPDAVTGILILDGNTGQITDVNPFLVKLRSFAPLSCSYVGHPVNSRAPTPG